jgi:hypothetical protein
MQVDSKIDNLLEKIYKKKIVKIENCIFSIAILTIIATDAPML